MTMKHCRLWNICIYHIGLCYLSYSSLVANFHRRDVNTDQLGLLGKKITLNILLSNTFIY